MNKFDFETIADSIDYGFGTDFSMEHTMMAGAQLHVKTAPSVIRALKGLSEAVLYRFDVNIREASVLGLVGAGGIGAPLIFAMNQYAWSDVSAIFLGFVLLVWGIDVGSARLRHRRSTAAASE